MEHPGVGHVPGQTKVVIPGHHRGFALSARNWFKRRTLNRLPLLIGIDTIRHMKPRVYIETTIPSYLTARPSRDLVRAAHQQATRDWWERSRGRFEAVISQLVLDECSAGDPAASTARLEAIADLPLLAATEATIALARALIDGVPLPARARADAAHLATAAVNGIEYLLT